MGNDSVSLIVVEVSPFVVYLQRENRWRKREKDGNLLLEPAGRPALFLVVVDFPCFRSINRCLLVFGESGGRPLFRYMSSEFTCFFSRLIAALRSSLSLATKTKYNNKIST